MSVCVCAMRRCGRFEKCCLLPRRPLDAIVATTTRHADHTHTTRGGTSRAILRRQMQMICIARRYGRRPHGGTRRRHGAAGVDIRLRNCTDMTGMVTVCVATRTDGRGDASQRVRGMCGASLRDNCDDRGGIACARGRYVVEIGTGAWARCDASRGADRDEE